MSCDQPTHTEKEILDLLDKQVTRYQAIVTRLASNSVQVKTWCVTAVGALAAVAVNNDRGGLFFVALAILVIFMLLDVQYLWLERRFRDGAHQLVRQVVGSEPRPLAAGGEGAPLYAFFATRPPATRGGRRLGVAIRTFMIRTFRLTRGGVGETMLSFTILPFYLVIAALLLVGVVAT